MHELSIARSLMGLVGRHAPRGQKVRRVHVRVGPLRAIEPDAMQWAWRAATVSTVYEGAQLKLQLVCWQMRCPACGRQWEGDDPLGACLCGCQDCHPVGDDQLTLVSLEVDQHAADKVSAPVTP